MLSCLQSFVCYCVCVCACACMCVCVCCHCCLQTGIIAARSLDKLQITAEEYRNLSGEVHAVQADVSKEEDCKTIVDKAVTEFGGVDILILNAAISPYPQWFATMSQPVSG